MQSWYMVKGVSQTEWFPSDQLSIFTDFTHLGEGVTESKYDWGLVYSCLYQSIFWTDDVNAVKKVFKNES